MEECDQSNSNFLKHFELFIPCLTIYFLKVTALVSLKVATIRYFRGARIPQKFTLWRLLF